MTPEKKVLTDSDKYYVQGPNMPRTEVQINDRGENFNPDEKGSIPNYDKVEIIYESKKV